MGKTKMPRAKLGKYSTPKRVGELISVDIWGLEGGLQVSENGTRCVL